MSIEPINLEPSPNNWFSTTVEYQGHGKAEFLDPPGNLEGPAMIRFDGFGEYSIEMVVENFAPQDPMIFGLMQFLGGRKPVEGEHAIQMSFGTPENRCVKLTVNTQDGIFSTEGEIHFSFSELNLFGSPKGTKIQFYPLFSQYDTSSVSSPKYWVLPLSNLISEFNQRHEALDNHPLRVYPTPSIPSDISEDDRFSATLQANRRNRLIIFNFNNGLGFIEALPDFSEKKNQLFAGRERNTITAIMVGETGSHSIEFKDIEQWAPVNFLPLLGLSTGVEVGSPWIELRNSQGELIRRMHYKLGHPVFSKGHAAIREEIHCGIGQLLTDAQNSPDFAKSFLRVSIRHIIRAGSYSLTIEDRLRQVFVTFDNLCEEFKVGKILPINDKRKKLVDAAIKGTIAVIQELARQASEEGESSDAKVLQKIAQSISQSRAVSANFGADVIALIEKFDFPDANIISDYYVANPRPDRRKWADVLPYYRGIVMHRSYFNFQKDHDVDDVLKILDHLHDILVRIMFKILGYNGEYQPTVISMATSLPIDWVKPDLPASRLGY